MASLLARLGRFSARHRIGVVIAWALALAVAAVIAITGMRFTDGSFDVPGTDSSAAMETLEDAFGDTAADPSLQLVVRNPDGSIADVADEVVDALSAAVDVTGATGVSDPFDPSTGMISEDGSTAVSTITFAELGEDDIETATEQVDDIAAQLRAQGLDAEVGGSLASAVPDILGPSEIVGAAVAFLVLVLTFGSLVAAGANMGGALVGVGVGVLGVLAFSAISPIGSVTPILAVMLGLAVGIDYGLFVLSRFRSELREGRPIIEAIAHATGTAGSSVAFAGATVIIALLGLTVVGIPFIGQMGVAAAFAVAVAVLMSLTLLPALMSWMGAKVLSRAERGARPAQARTRSPRWVRGWARGVTRRPWLALAASIAVLGVASAPVLSMQTSLSIPGGEDPDATQRAAYDLIAEEFGDGAQDPLVVLVQAKDAASVLGEVQEEIADLPNVAAVYPAGVSDDGDVAMLSVLAETGPLDERTTGLVTDIRAIEIDEVTLSVTGATAMGLDSDEQLRTALVLYVLLIVGLSFILLVLLFRSLLVPLVATVGFLLSLGAGLGATVAVFQWGWLDAVVTAPQGNPLLSLLPILVTGILFGLAMDYQVFLVSRIHEAYRHGLTARDAILGGFERSATVVVAAAAIMAAVFIGFALSPSSLVGSIALALAVGVVADAFLVRMVLVPATLAIVGRAAWWLPGWLGRILPHVDVEGAELERPEPVRAV